MLTEIVRVLEHRKIRGDCRVITFASPRIAPVVRPGQFVNLRVEGFADRVLRRPFSVFKAGEKKITILYKIVGAGTALMARLRPGDTASLIGPLGNGYPRPDAGALPVLVAGGYGAAALYLLAERARQKGIIFIGGRSARDILCAADFRQLGWKVFVATEDGSLGRKGMVTDILVKYLGNTKMVGREHLAPPDKNGNGGAGTHAPYLGTKPEIYSCGPMGMLKAVSRLAVSGGWKAWLSLDRHMGCGVGACLACVQKVRVPGARSGEKGWKWARICTEGPVFECREIIWE